MDSLNEKHISTQTVFPSQMGWMLSISTQKRSTDTARTGDCEQKVPWTITTSLKRKCIMGPKKKKKSQRDGERWQ